MEKVVFTTKILSKDYLSDGEFPIVSQEEGLISGYWNKREDLFRLKKPVVLFGDHTRVLKYVDFDFVIGADGVKILQPIEQLFAKFLYYFLQWYKVPSLGYSRHYKLLKEITVPIPPVDVQKEICSLLDKLNLLIEKKKEQIAELDNLAQSLFYDMFGDPITNEKGWSVKKMGEVCQIDRGGSPRPIDQYITDDPKGINWIKIGDATDGGMVIKTVKEKIRPEGVKKSRFVHKGDFLLSNSMSFGKPYILGVDGCIHDGWLVISDEKEVFDKVFLYYFLGSPQTYECFKKMAVGGVVNNLNKEMVKKLNVMIPTQSHQQAFAKKVEAIELQKKIINMSIKDVQTLLDAKMDYYFGE